MRKLGFGLLAVGVAVFGIGAVASAGNNLPTTLELNTYTPDPGGQYVATYTGCFPGDTVTFEQPDSTPTSQQVECAGGVGLAGPQGLRAPRQVPGVAVATFTAPTAPGTYTITAAGTQSPSANAQFVIAQATTTTLPPTTAAPTTAAPTTAAPTTAAPVTTSGVAPALPETGPSEAVPTAAIAVALLAVGGGLVILASRRSAGHSS